LQAIGDSSPPVVVNTQDGAGLQPLSHQQQLQALPDLAQLTNLRKLSLAHNRDLSVLPGSLSVLTQLEVLDARSCSLRFPPDELWACVGLRELLLGDNVLAGLPDDISKLQKLEVSQTGGTCNMGM
jgi:Leucine-rich repeat (LRR) protein